ncbi:hypothetical protein [Marinicella rhabdoformis]|uniref:hypothetical protein n=1 Tax=Marinicella rhabdoformis TaxID=2580566 RepID=UPI0012AECE5E|nr:hypothetical protein [Marinicella rhabdoformis]
MKKLLILSMLLMSAVVLAQLPSWGMTEQQYKMPNRPAKLEDIGKEAVNNKWQLKVIAPQAWHSNIRAGLSKGGERNVMMTFKDSLHQSVSITATKAKYMGQTVKSSGNNQVVQKQVVIDDKPEIDTTVERPEFGDEFMAGKPTVAEVEIDMALPKSEHKVVKNAPKPTKTVSQPKPVQKPVVKPEPKSVAVVEVEPEAGEVETEEERADEVRDAAKTYLRKRYAKNKKANGTLSYGSITEDDELYIKDNVVLIVREKNSRTFYYWMKGTFDQSVHAIKHKSQERYEKTEAAVAVVKAASSKADDSKSEVVERTSLVFTAVDDVSSDQDVLRRDHIRNKAVTKAYSAEQLKSGDLVYTRNDTALVVRRLSRTNEIYFWLKGDVNITENIEMMKPDEFKIK